MAKNKTFNKFITEADLNKGKCCPPVPKTDDGVTTLNFLEKVYLQDSNALHFDGDGTAANPLTGDVRVSTDPRSTSLFSKDSTGLFLNSPKLRDATTTPEFPMYKLPEGAIADGLISVSKVGATSTATYSKAGIFDRIAVTGGDANSYIQINRQFSLERRITRIKFKVNSIGAAPLIGIRNIWPGGTYSNFNNPQSYNYMNLATGALTVYNNGLASQASANDISATVAAGDILEYSYEMNDKRDSYVNVIKLSSLNEETSAVYHKKTIANLAAGTVDHSYYAMILADCDVTILEFSVAFTNAPRPLVLTVGDSLSSGSSILETDSVSYYMKQKQPYQVANISAGSIMLKGMLALMWEVIKLKPKYALISNNLDGVYYGYSNPASPNYAAWVVDFEKQIAIMKANNIKPIFFYCSYIPILDSSGAKVAFYRNYLATNHPTDVIAIELLTPELQWDGTAFHPNGFTYNILANKVIAAIQADGGI